RRVNRTRPAEWRRQVLRRFRELLCIPGRAAARRRATQIDGKESPGVRCGPLSARSRSRSAHSPGRCMSSFPQYLLDWSCQGGIMTQQLKSCLCTQAQIESETFQFWSEKLRPAWDSSGSGLKLLHHRKLWEWCYIAQALWERGLLRPGKRGLG